jgi:hypothetical protein
LTLLNFETFVDFQTKHRNKHPFLNVSAKRFRRVLETFSGVLSKSGVSMGSVNGKASLGVERFGNEGV